MRPLSNPVAYATQHTVGAIHELPLLKIFLLAAIRFLILLGTLPLFTQSLIEKYYDSLVEPSGLTSESFLFQLHIS
jgi:hypothetical protein